MTPSVAGFQVIPLLIPGLVTLAFLVAGRAALRGRPGWEAAWAAVAVGAGWAALAGAPGLWVRPVAVVEHLPAAAAAVALGAVAARRPGLGSVGGWAAVVAAWVVSGAPAARGESWRVWFGTMGLTWALRRVGVVDEAGVGLALALTLGVGLAAAGAPPAAMGVAVVLLCASVGGALWRGARMPAALPAVAVVAVDLVAGQAVRGGAGMSDVVCVAAVAAAAMRGWVGRRLQRWVGRRGAVVLAPMLLALAGTAVAWMAARAVR